jgi:hypothetical protein
MAGEHEVAMPTKAQIRKTGSSRTPAWCCSGESAVNSFLWKLACSDRCVVLY